MCEKHIRLTLAQIEAFYQQGLITAVGYVYMRILVEGPAGRKFTATPGDWADTLAMPERTYRQAKKRLQDLGMLAVMAKTTETLSVLPPSALVASDAVGAEFPATVIAERQDFARGRQDFAAERQDFAAERQDFAAERQDFAASTPETPSAQGFQEPSYIMQINTDKTHSLIKREKDEVASKEEEALASAKPQQTAKEKSSPVRKESKCPPPALRGGGTRPTTAELIAMYPEYLAYAGTDTPWLAEPRYEGELRYHPGLHDHFAKAWMAKFGNSYAHNATNFHHSVENRPSRIVDYWKEYVAHVKQLASNTQQRLQAGVEIEQSTQEQLIGALPAVSGSTFIGDVIDKESENCGAIDVKVSLPEPQKLALPPSEQTPQPAPNKGEIPLPHAEADPQAYRSPASDGLELTPEECQQNWQKLSGMLKGMKRIGGNKEERQVREQQTYAERMRKAAEALEAERMMRTPREPEIDDGEDEPIPF